MIDYDPDSSLEGTYDKTFKIPMYVDNGITVNLLPTSYYEQATFLHHLPKYDATGEIIRTGNGTIAAHFWADIQLNIQGCLIQLKVLVCDTQARTSILLSRMALEQLQLWQIMAPIQCILNKLLSHYLQPRNMRYYQVKKL